VSGGHSAVKGLHRARLAALITVLPPPITLAANWIYGLMGKADFSGFPDFQSGDLALYINGLVNYYSYG
jgi:hypothetical protein